MTPNLSSYFQQWRSADEAARQEERRLFYAAVHSVDDGGAPSDQEWIFCGQLRTAADKLFYLATASARVPGPGLAPAMKHSTS